MKRIFLIIIVSVLIFSCSSNDDNLNVINPDFMGKWILTATYNDPGDGSGVYKSVDSEKTIEFFNNGTFSLNGPLCELPITVGENSTGKVRNSSYSNNFRLISNEECTMDNSSFDDSPYEYIALIKNSDLIIYYTACIEGCAQKYQKLKAE